MDKELRILIVEDYEDDAELIILELSKSYNKITHEVVDNENSLRSALNSKKWDAIISDYKLPGFNALAALRVMQQMNLDLPFIIVSGTIGEELAVEAMKAGAHDYIMKGNLRRLAPALEREIRESEVRRQRKQSAKRLMEQELLLRSVVDFLPVGLVLIDRNRNIIMANKEFRSTWGDFNSFNVLTELNVKISDYESKKVLSQRDWAIIKAIEGSNSIINEIIQIKTSDDNAKVILNSVVPIIEQNSSSATYAIMVNQDITKLKQDETKLKQTLIELERSNKELEQFAYVASHDLQEPLRMVASFTQLLAKRYKGKLDPDADEYIDFAVNGAKRMQQLINDLLNYSRATSYKKGSEYLDLNILLQSILESMNSLVLESCAEISISQLPQISASPIQMQQLFQNLISNAIKFRRNGISPIIQIDCQRQINNWLFSVKDNGIGIPAAYKDKIFTIFQRLHDKDEYPGTGVGLALCKKIVEQLGGHIWVESVPHEGSTFFFTLPIENF